MEGGNHPCENCGASFLVESRDLVFYKRISPKVGSKIFEIPPPKFCPNCRLQRRLSFRGEFNYFSRSCDKCKKSIVSVHNPDNPYPVYCYKCWWDDSFDSQNYRQTYDFSKSFLEQFIALRARVPQLAMMNDNGVRSENCEYCQDFSLGKDCYLTTGTWEAQEVCYSTQCSYAKEVYESFATSVDCELVYECAHSQKLYFCTYLSKSFECNNCHFGYDLRGCANCIGCVGLRRREFCIFNEQLSKEEFQKAFEGLSLETRSGQSACRQKFAEFLKPFPKRATFQSNCEECVGDSLYNCKNVEGFGVFNGAYSRFVWTGDSPQNCYDVLSTGKPQWCYECVTPDNSYQALFCTWVWNSKDVYYSDNCHSCQNLLGCIGLKRAKNCILNEPLSQLEYEIQLAKIIEALQEQNLWGEFFPMQSAPFPYNHSRAFDLFPLSEADARTKNLHWSKRNNISFEAGDYQIPNSIISVQDNILGQNLGCVTCNKAYRVQKSDLRFYRKLSLPVPECCPDCRRNQRFQRLNCYGLLYERQCKLCALDIRAVHSGECGEDVLCDRCYLQDLGET